MKEKNNNHKKFSPEEEQQMWENIKQAIDIKERRKRFVKVTSVAAVSLILLFLGILTGYNTLSKPDVYFAETGNSNIRLADGSVVTLLKGAKLTVEKSFPADTRDVFLEGDAFFKVTKSKEHPFVVHGSDYETKVLGTVFKVTQHGSTFNVDLFEGKVLVYKTGSSSQPVPLAPKQTFTNYGIPQATSVSETRDKKSNPSADKPASLTFTNCPINGAVKVIEKTYGIKVEYPRELENEKITISFSNVTAETYIQSLAAQFNLHIKQNDSIFELEK